MDQFIELFGINREFIPKPEDLMEIFPYEKTIIQLKRIKKIETPLKKLMQVLKVKQTLIT
jgi:hypothetical protein